MALSLTIQSPTHLFQLLFCYQTHSGSNNTQIVPLGDDKEVPTILRPKTNCNFIMSVSLEPWPITFFLSTVRYYHQMVKTHEQCDHKSPQWWQTKPNAGWSHRKAPKVPEKSFYHPCVESSQLPLRYARLMRRPISARQFPSVMKRHSKLNFCRWYIFKDRVFRRR